MFQNESVRFECLETSDYLQGTVCKHAQQIMVRSLN